MAAGLLFAFAPEESMKVARAAIGLAEEARQSQASVSEQALAYCKANPSICLAAAKQAADASALPASTRPAKP